MTINRALSSQTPLSPIVLAQEEATAEKTHLVRHAATLIKHQIQSLLRIDQAITTGVYFHREVSTRIKAHCLIVSEGEKEEENGAHGEAAPTTTTTAAFLTQNTSKTASRSKNHN